MREETIRQALENKLIVIVRGLKNPAHMLGLAEALYAGGVRMMEVTFDQKSGDLKATTDAIALLAKHFAGRILPGAGTVLTPEQVQMARDAGARYIISPNVSVDVIEKTKSLDLVSMPGALTPTDIVTAYGAGADIVKVFPIGVMGAAYLKAVKAPLAHIPMMAVGGVTEKNAAEFLRAGACGVGVGGNLVNNAWIEAGEFEKITDLARAYVQAVNE